MTSQELSFSIVGLKEGDIPTLFNDTFVEQLKNTPTSSLDPKRIVK